MLLCLPGDFELRRLFALGQREQVVVMITGDFHLGKIRLPSGSVTGSGALRGRAIAAEDPDFAAEPDDQ